jgi:hypothetical protein
LFCPEVGLVWNPGNIDTNDRKFRPALGRFVTRVSSSDRLTWPLVTSISGLTSVTVTDSLTADTRSERFTVVVC